MECQGCEEKEATFVLYLMGGGIEEYYCNECMANVLINAPEEVYQITTVRI